MKTEEARAIVDPIYDVIEKNMMEGKLDDNFKYIHPEAVVVQKGKTAHYGKGQIAESQKKFHDEYQPKHIKRAIKVCCGCECCICVSLEVSFETPKGPAKVIEHHIWKKHDGHWKMYHLEYDMTA